MQVKPVCQQLNIMIVQGTTTRSVSCSGSMGEEVWVSSPSPTPQTPLPYHSGHIPDTAHNVRVNANHTKKQTNKKQTKNLLSTFYVEHI